MTDEIGDVVFLLCFGFVNLHFDNAFQRITIFLSSIEIS